LPCLLVSALVQRARTGEGCTIDVGMLDCQVAIQENAFARYFATGQIPKPLGTRHPVFTPFQAFQTADGWLVLAMTGGEKNQWALFCAALDRVDLIDDPRFETGQTRTDHYDILEPVLSAELRKKTTAAWVAEFEALEIPCGPLLNIAEVAAHPQVQARNMLVDVPHPSAGAIRTTALPIKFDGHDLGPRRPAPGLGEHTAEVLRRLAGEGEPEP
jgi:CoA:oxalate CoA-transferase